MLTHDQQIVLLQTIYNAFRRWSSRFSFACHKGCATCCTQSVTMTTLEGQGIVAYLAANGRQAELDASAFQYPVNTTTRLTTNTFVGAHLKGKEVEEPAGWDMRPCPFLAENACTIYPVRPFGCRLFASLASCATNGAADMPPGYLAASTILLQCIEHLDNNGRWDTLVGILNGLAGKGRAETGFLVAPEERGVVAPLTDELFQHEINGKPFEQWLAEARS